MYPQISTTESHKRSWRTHTDPEHWAGTRGKTNRQSVSVSRYFLLLPSKRLHPPHIWAKTRMVEKGHWLSHPTILLNYIFAFSKTSCSNHFCHTAPSFYNQWANHKNRIQSPSLFCQDVPFFRCFLKLTWKRKGKIKYERFVEPNDVGKFFWKIVINININFKCQTWREEELLTLWGK